MYFVINVDLNSWYNMLVVTVRAVIHTASLTGNYILLVFSPVISAGLFMYQDYQLVKSDSLVVQMRTVKQSMNKIRNFIWMV